MKQNLLWVFIFVVFASSQANAFDLATRITHHNGKVVLSSLGYAKLALIKVNTTSKGRISLHGRVSVRGTANIVMWVKVEGNYYFSKLPALQNLDNQNNVDFQIPFYAAEKTISEVLLEVELMTGGEVVFENINLINNL